MQVGLFSVATADLTNQYLDLLETLSSAAGVSYIATALQFARPIVHGINLLTGSADDSMLEIGISRTESHPLTGWYVAIRAPKSELDVSTIRIDPHDGRLLHGDGSAVSEFPYLVFETAADSQRNDWHQIPELVQPFRSIQLEYRRGRVEQTADAVTTFCRAALTCNDLQFEDAERLAAKVKVKYVELGPPRAGVRGRVGRDFPNLESFALYG